MDKLIKKILSHKKIIIIIGIVLILLISLFIIFNRSNIFKSNKLVIDKNTTVEKIKVDDFDEITVLSSRIEREDNSSSIYIKIKNNTKEVIDNSNLKLTIYDKDKNLLLESKIENIKRLEIGAEVEFQVSTNNNLKDASIYIVEKI